MTQRQGLSFFNRIALKNKTKPVSRPKRNLAIQGFMGGSDFMSPLNLQHFPRQGVKTYGGALVKDFVGMKRDKMMDFMRQNLPVGLPDVFNSGFELPDIAIDKINDIDFVAPDIECRPKKGRVRVEGRQIEAPPEIEDIQIYTPGIPGYLSGQWRKKSVLIRALENDIRRTQEQETENRAWFNRVYVGGWRGYLRHQKRRLKIVQNESRDIGHKKIKAGKEREVVG